MGRQLTGVRHNSNSAEFGGGVISMGRGTSHDARTFSQGTSLEMSTVFDRCTLVNKTAFSDGGAAIRLIGQGYVVWSTLRVTPLCLEELWVLPARICPLSTACFAGIRLRKMRGQRYPTGGLFHPSQTAPLTTTPLLRQSGVSRDIFFPVTR